MREWLNPAGIPARVSRPLMMLIFGLVALLVAGCSGFGSGASDDVPPAPVLELTPQNGAKDVLPTARISAAAVNGKIVNAVLTNAEGEQVAGAISPDGVGWAATEPLGYGKTYTLAVTAQGASGPEIIQQSTFSTVSPGAQTFVSMNPLDGQKVGVGQPLAFYFSADAPAPDKAKAEEAIKIHTEPAVEGAFYWFGSREVHWRPKEFWKPGTKVSIDINVYGKELGNGVWGQEDRKATVTIGDAVVLKADGASHQMRIEKNGKLLRTMPVSLGKPSFPSSNGVHVVTEHHAKKVMDSSTYGLPVEAGGYRTEVEWAVRISNGGEFLHAAPWSVGDQGRRNVSHGCINMSTADAKWIFNLVRKGDVVQITNSGGPNLRAWDGFGDWQIPWEQWVKGNK
ncbi:L,D-transpeptidase [Saccharopolyspora phatthalungensis]|uniref:Lipoprotein-anchoring transpeptidase ErfK/SrfK n=1 Tax=Saccharopolyspora phatthalungensis TaxID=664693 RepID=A0A840PZK4_9PSEU|nr:Ig-like domain-containing protein [Saccharopolyspora phatthalungensis]MBB5153170.1 lipoprotein-anchoring transpeptidase ErfK/SrfK [Saccharopolyspora phatthalungensis]